MGIKSAGFGKEARSESQARAYAEENNGTARQDPVSGNWFVDYEGEDINWDPAGWLDGDQTNPYAEEGLADWEYDLSKIPGVSLLGPSSALDAARNLREQNAAQQTWDVLATTRPDEDQLSVDYGTEGLSDELGGLLQGHQVGPDSELERDSGGLVAQRRALRDLQTIGDRGGYTSADRAASSAMRQQQGTALRGANAAAAQQMGARGMGGGGSELAMRLSGGEQMSQNNAMADASIQQTAMARAMQALQGQANVGANVDAGELARQNALDRFNQQQTAWMRETERDNMDWRRGRSERNNQWQNRSRESAADAARDAYGMRERWAAGKTGQYQAGQDNRRQDAARRDQQGQNLLGLVGEAFS